METTFTNNPFKNETPATTNKKVWASPTLEVIDRGDVEGGPVTGVKETQPVSGTHGSQS